MSVVIAIKEGKKIIMGCDSQVSKGYHRKEQLDNKNVCKIWEIENCKNGLMGVVGSLRDGQLIQCQEHLIEELAQLKGIVDYKYVVTQLTKKIFDVLSVNNRANRDNFGNYDGTMNSNFIFAYKDMAFLITGEFCVTPIVDYLVCGCGDELAIGVLESNKDLSPQERIEEAIKVCSKKSTGVDDCIIIKTT